MNWLIITQNAKMKWRQVMILSTTKWKALQRKWCHKRSWVDLKVDNFFLFKIQLDQLKKSFSLISRGCLFAQRWIWSCTSLIKSFTVESVIFGQNIQIIYLKANVWLANYQYFITFLNKNINFIQRLNSINNEVFSLHVFFAPIIIQ